MGIVKRYNRTLIEKLFPSQDAFDLLTLHLNKVSRVWVKNLPIVVEYINNSITCQLGISPINAIEKEEVLARSEEHTSELQSQSNLVCRLLLEKKKKNQYT